MAKRKIFYVIPQLRYGGGEKQFYLLLKYLDRDRFDPSVICLEAEGDMLDAVRALEIPVYTVVGCKASQIKQMAGLFRRYRPDVVHTWLNNEWGRLAALFYKFTTFSPVRLVASERDEMSQSSRRFLFFIIWLNRTLSFLTHTVTFNSPAALRYFENGFFKKGVAKFIGNGIERDEIKRRTSIIPSSQIDFVVVARFVDQKNHLQLVDWVAALPPGSPVRFWFVGDGPLRQLVEQRVVTLGLSDVVFFQGKRSDVSDFLLRCNVGVLVSKTEGFSNAVLEYLAHGLPVIVSDVGANSLCVDENGFLIGGKFEFIAAVSRYIECPDLLSRHSEKSYSIAERYLIHDVVGQYEGLYVS